MTKVFEDVLVNVFYNAIEEMERGDKKYGAHKGPQRAIGALKAEVQELETELFAEDANPHDVETEAIQTIAMALKLYRDICHTT